MSRASLLPLIENRRVILCVGCGGVGKTTVAAAVGLAAAKRGKRVLCLTIDPAKRLANSLGFSRMTADEQRVSPELFEQAGLTVPGSLTVMMLDTKRTFDELVERHASSPEARDRILRNKLYQYVSSSLAGTQEYMAMEKLLSVREDSDYDLIVLDTPPTSNALDFLEAPERLTDFIDSAAMRWFVQAFESTGKFSLNLVAKSVAVVLKGIGKLTGGGFLEQVAEFVTSLNELFGGFKERAEEVGRAFRGDEFAYVLVTTPTPMSIREVVYFADRLQDQGMRSDAFVVNRVHRRPRAAASEQDVRAALERHAIELSDRAPERLLRALGEEAALAAVDAEHLRDLDSRAERGLRVEIPALPSDVHELVTLSGVSDVIAPP